MIGIAGYSGFMGQKKAKEDDPGLDLSEVQVCIPEVQYVARAGSASYESRLAELKKLGGSDFHEPGLDTPRVSVSFNWAPLEIEERKKIRDWWPELFAECRKSEVDETSVPALPSGVPAVVTFRIPVSEMKKWDIKSVTEEVRKSLHVALRNRPTFREAPKMAPVVPPERKFLVSCRNNQFRRDLKRYKLHVKEGLSYRQIAYLELRERRKPLDWIKGSKTTKKAARGERTVGEAVKRIHEAIHMKPFKAKRRRLDNPGQGADTYRCDTHGEFCPRGCPALNKWLCQIEPGLPTNTTGKLKGEVEQGEVEQDSC